MCDAFRVSFRKYVPVKSPSHDVWPAAVCLQIVGDAVGWGFVVRGARPCYVQAVEPCGPAAAAGMKVGICFFIFLSPSDFNTSGVSPLAPACAPELQVRQFVVSVNGLNVLDMDYRTVSHLILTGPRTVVMEVMEETDNWGRDADGSRVKSVTDALEVMPKVHLFF